MKNTKECRTGGRLIRLLAAHGYVQLDHSKKPPFPILLLTKLTRDKVTANDFLSWQGVDKLGRTFKAVDTDLVDLNEKLLQYNFPPLVFRIQSETAEEKAVDLRDNFGKKVEFK